MRGIAVIGVVLAITAGAALAHRSSTYSESASGNEIRLWLANKYDVTTTYDLRVLTRDMRLVPSDLWRSNYEGDRLVLEPEEVATDIVIRVKERGKYYACTIVADVPDNILGLRSQICLRLWYK